MSMSTCRTQSDSMPENTMLVAVRRGDRKWGVGGGAIREGRQGGGKEGRGMRGSQSWKQMRFQLPPKGSNFFCLVKLVWQPVPEGGCSIVEWPCSWRFLFVFSPDPKLVKAKALTDSLSTTNAQDVTTRKGQPNHGCLGQYLHWQVILTQFPDQFLPCVPCKNQTRPWLPMYMYLQRSFRIKTYPMPLCTILTKLKHHCTDLGSVLILQSAPN